VVDQSRSHSRHIAFARCLKTLARLHVAVAILANAASPALAQPAATRLEANKATVREVINKVQRDGDFAAFEQLFAADYVDHTPFPGYGSDRESTRTIYLALRAAFPDLRATINQQVAEGDFVTTFKTYHGTHRGVFLGMAPTEREVRFDAMDIMRVRDGKIVGHWGVTDTASLMRQLTEPKR